MTVTIFDDRRCLLGEGVFWHPERQELFWFDILNKRLLSRRGTVAAHWQFENFVSAAGWIDKSRLLVASAQALLLFNLDNSPNGTIEFTFPLESNDARTRSNDGRSDPWGGFWISTMGCALQAGAGAIYRFYHGKIHSLYSNLTIPNAICFSPDRQFAYFTDTPTQKIMRQSLDAKTGFPVGNPQLWLDLSHSFYKPDGAIIDSNGHFYNAQWGAGRIAIYTPNGAFQHAINFPTTQISCVALGGKNRTTLFATSAYDNIERLDTNAGKTFSYNIVGKNAPQAIREYKVILY